MTPGGRRAAPQGPETVRLYANYQALAFGLRLGAQRAIQLLPFAAARAGFVWSTMCTLAAGACLIGYAANQAEPHALGDGTSLLITASIMSSARAGPPGPVVGLMNPVHTHVRCTHRLHQSNACGAPTMVSSLMPVATLSSPCHDAARWPCRPWTVPVRMCARLRAQGTRSSCGLLYRSSTAAACRRGGAWRLQCGASTRCCAAPCS